MSVDWRKIKHFTPGEWGDYEKVAERLIYLVDEFQDFIDEKYGPSCSCYIHAAYENSGHSTNSQHYLGLAVDLHVTGVGLLNTYFAAERFPFTGIGVYPFWNKPGLHLDIRETPVGSSRGQRWWRDEEGRYRELNAAAVSVILNKDHLTHG